MFAFVCVVCVASVRVFLPGAWAAEAQGNSARAEERRRQFLTGRDIQDEDCSYF